MLRGLYMEDVTYLQDSSTALAHSISSTLGVSVFLYHTALKKKIYSVIKYRAITLTVKNSHRAERWVLQTPTETI